MFEKLKKIAVFIEKKQNALFNYDIDKQKKLLNKLRNPKNLIDRSYLQYKCQMRLYGFLLSTVINILSYPLLLVFIIRFRIFYLFKNNYKGNQKFNAVFFSDGKPSNIIPNSLNNKYNEIKTDPYVKSCFSNQDLLYIIKIIFRYPLSPFFALKSAIKVSKYRYVIESYKPEAIIVCAEYSYTSSLLTDFCRKHGTLHINVMHGEKLFFIRDSFFEFDKCYIWDNYYKTLFLKLRASESQFIVEIPNSLKFSSISKAKKKFDYTYYLASESETVLKNISLFLQELAKNGKKISVRPHPRYSNMILVKELFAFANVEDCKSLSIENSLQQTQCAIALYSTVLNQAICNSIKIAIDDISNEKSFAKLSKMDYICLKYDHELLSNILKECRK